MRISQLAGLVLCQLPRGQNRSHDPEHALTPFVHPVMLPKDARIADFDYCWHILRWKDGVQGHWTANFKNAEEALAAI